MTCKIWFKDSIFMITVLEIRLNAKFKAELDIFFKFGSKKQELLTGLNIENGRAKIQEQTHTQRPTQFQKQFDQGQIGKSIRLVFELRSKSYNAYAGQVEIDFSNAKNQNSRRQVKIDYCIDENASLVYEIRALADEKARNEAGKYANKNVQRIQKSPGNDDKKLLRKKSSIEQQSYKAMMLKKSSSNECLKPPQLNSKLLSVKTPPKKHGQSPSNHIKVKKHITSASDYEIFMDEPSDLSQIQSLADKSQMTKKISETVFNGQFTKKIIGLEKKLHEEKQKCINLELELQKSRNEVKELTKQFKVVENKLHMIETDFKKTKSQQIFLKNQNKILKQSQQVLTQKINEKTDQLTSLKGRNQTYQKSYRQELKNVYEKLQTVHQEKESECHEKLNLEERWEQIQKKHSYQIQQRQLSIEMEKEKLLKTIKKLQKQNERNDSLLEKSLKALNQQIQVIFRSHGQISDSFRGIQFQSKHSDSFKDILSKIQQISIELHNQLNQKTEQNNIKNSQLRQLKLQLISLSKQIQLAKDELNNQQLSHKDAIQKLQTIIQKDKQLSTQQIKQLKATIQANQTQISQLHDQIIIRQKELNSFKTSNQKHELTITKLNQNIIANTQQFKTQLNTANDQKTKLSQQLNLQINQLNNKIKQQKQTTTQQKQNNSNLTKTIDSLEKQILQHQNQLKQANQTASLMLKQLTEFKQFIEPNKDESSIKQTTTIKKKESLQQTNIFQQNLKAIQQAKRLIQNKLQNHSKDTSVVRQEKTRLEQEFKQLEQEFKQMEQEFKQLEQIFNLNQKSSNTVKSCILNMKKQNQYFKVELKKKQEFDLFLLNEFQCNIHQIRQRLIAYKTQNEELLRFKKDCDTQAAIKTKKLNQIIQSLNSQLQIVLQHQQWAQSQFSKIHQVTIDMKKSINANDIIISQLINIKPIKQGIQTIEKMVNKIELKASQTKSSFMEKWKTRSRNTVSLRKIEKYDTMNKNLLKQKSSGKINPNSQQKQQMKPGATIKLTQIQQNSSGLRLQKAKSTKTSRQSQLLQPIDEHQEEANKKGVKQVKKQGFEKEQLDTEDKDAKLKKVTSLKKLQGKITPFRELRQKYTDKTSKNSLHEKNITPVPVPK